MTAQRGGARPNSGRKPVNAQPMVTTAFSIRYDQAEWLKQFPNRSEVVQRALDKAMKAKR